MFCSRVPPPHELGTTIISSNNKLAVTISPSQDQNCVWVYLCLCKSLDFSIYNQVSFYVDFHQFVRLGWLAFALLKYLKQCCICSISNLFFRSGTHFCGKLTDEIPGKNLSPRGIINIENVNTLEIKQCRCNNDISLRLSSVKKLNAMHIVCHGDSFRESKTISVFEPFHDPII